MKRVVLLVLLSIVLIGCEGGVHISHDHHPNPPPVFFDYDRCFDWSYSELIIHFGFPAPSEVHSYEHLAGDWCDCVNAHGNWIYDYNHGIYTFDFDNVCYHEIVGH